MKSTFLSDLLPVTTATGTDREVIQRVILLNS